MRDRPYKLLVNADGTGAASYDVEADPHEKTDVARRSPSAAAAGTKPLLAWRKSLS